MIIQRLTPLVNNLMHETLFTKSMLQKENESLSILFLGQAKIQLLSEWNYTRINCKHNFSSITHQEQYQVRRNVGYIIET